MTETEPTQSSAPSSRRWIGPASAVVGISILIVLIAISLRDPDERPVRVIGSDPVTPAMPPGRRAATDVVEEPTVGDMAEQLRSMAMWRRPEYVMEHYAGKWLREPGVVGVVRWVARESGGSWMLTVSEIGSGVQVIAFGDSSLTAFEAGRDVYVKGRVVGADASSVTLEEAEVLPREK